MNIVRYLTLIRSPQSRKPLDDFYEFFKSMNEANGNENDTDDMDGGNETDEIINSDINNEINQPITESEILKNVKMLKNNKSPGSDSIVNEQIKPLILSGELACGRN